MHHHKILITRLGKSLKKQLLPGSGEGVILKVVTSEYYIVYITVQKMEIGERLFAMVKNVRLRNLDCTLVSLKLFWLLLKGLQVFQFNFQ